jgi:tetratricopeptide (TPR) repeat protein
MGYRHDAAELNEQVLNQLSDPTYLEQSIPDKTSRAAALIAFSQGQATRLRRAGNLDEARRILVQAVSGKDITGVTSAKQRSTLCYELGYLDFLYGNAEQAREWLRRSIEAAEEAGEQTGAYISRLVDARVGLLSGSVSAEKYRATNEEAFGYFVNPDVAGPHVARWLMTVQAQLLDLALWTRDTELIATQLRVLEEDPWIQQTGRHDIVQKHRARAAAVTGDWAESIALFEALLAEAPSHQEELARELYYYGQALLGSGDAAQAREVWERGLQTPDNAANWPWKPKIRTSIAQL